MHKCLLLLVHRVHPDGDELFFFHILLTNNITGINLLAGLFVSRMMTWRLLKECIHMQYITAILTRVNLIVIWVAGFIAHHPHAIFGFIDHFEVSFYWIYLSLLYHTFLFCYVALISYLIDGSVNLSRQAILLIETK